MNNVNAPKISVLLPLYNTKEEYLRECIDSILNQTFHDFELIILNDCSTDANVEKTVKSYSDKRIHYYTNEQNLGIADSRNKLMSLAKGQYFAIADHDDISLPDRLKKQAEYLDAHTEIGLLSGGIVQYDVKHERKYIKLHAEKDAEIKLRLSQECEIYHPAAMIRADVIKKHNLRYENDYTPSDDRVLWFRMIPFTKFHNLQEPLIIYRWHSGNTSKTQAFKMECAMQKAINLFRREYPELYDLCPKKKKIKILGLPLFTSVRTPKKYKLYLFGIIPVISVKMI